jgi:hypothetical protein
VPAVGPSDIDPCAGGNVPAVQPGAPHQPIAGRRDEPVPGEITDMVLEQNEARPPAREVDAASPSAVTMSVRTSGVRCSRTLLPSPLGSVRVAGKG